MKLKFLMSDDVTKSKITLVDGEKETDLKCIRGIHFGVNADDRTSPRIFLDVYAEDIELMIDTKGIIMVDNTSKLKYYVNKVEPFENDIPEER